MDGYAVLQANTFSNHMFTLSKKYKTPCPKKFTKIRVSCLREHVCVREGARLKVPLSLHPDSGWADSHLQVLHIGPGDLVSYRDSLVPNPLSPWRQNTAPVSVGYTKANILVDFVPHFLSRFLSLLISHHTASKRGKKNRL